MTYGKKYNRDMTGTEIAAAIRGDIKAAVAAGELPPARYSVRLARSAGGRSISIRFAGVPFDLFDHAFLLHQVETKGGRPFWVGEHLSRSHRALIRRLEQIGEAYNFDGSQIQEDYINVNYLLEIGADEEYAAARMAVELAAVRAELEQQRNARPSRQGPRYEIDYELNLKEQLAIARFYAEPARAEALEQQGGPLGQLGYLARLVVALDDWITAGGALPSRWAEAAPAPRNAGPAAPIYWPPRALGGGMR